jgi:hypothetical protein
MTVLATVIRQTTEDFCAQKEQQQNCINNEKLVLVIKGKAITVIGREGP